MDRLDELIVFVAILDAGSLADAARRLRRSPPSITRSLAAIEERAGVRLVQRTTRQLMPTQAGRRIAARARQLIADYHEAIGRDGEKLRTELRGLLRITAPTLFERWHVTPIVASFLDLHPGIRVEVVLTNRNLDLIKEGLDLAIRIGPLNEAGFVTRRVGQVRRVLFASPEYLSLILLRYKFFGRECLVIGAEQHGHRGSVLTSAAIRRRRMVAIEFGM